jgi:hypothetical protein
VVAPAVRIVDYGIIDVWPGVPRTFRTSNPYRVWTVAGLSVNPRVRSCPLRARQEERPRVITVTRGQTIKIPAGYGVSRWQRYNATDFPS